MDGRPVIEAWGAEDLADVAAARVGADGRGRLEAALRAVIRRLHGAAREAAPTRAEWLATVTFLAETGRLSDARRQEFVLLSDVLGVSALVEAINARRPEGATPNTPFDPFYLPNAPERADGADVCIEGTGERLRVSGEVRDLGGRPVVGARVETWQANAEGFYDNQRPDEQPEHNLRGAFRADAEGRFRYRSIRPGGYAVPADGPVGALLARLGRGAATPAHLNFRITAPGFETLTTQIFDAADPTLRDDALFTVRSGLTAAFRREGADWRTDLVFTLVPISTEADR